MNVSEIIPQGYYCYESISTDWEYREDGTPFFRIKPCPFLRQLKGYHEQESGYCLYLQCGDFGDRGGLLWDQVKSCNVNYGLSAWELAELDEHFKEQNEDKITE